MTRPSEGGHWYGRDGAPMYEVRAKDGSMRPATLRDARKFGWYPGVTSIIRCAAAPGLEIWKQNQVLLAALTLPRLPGEADEAFCKRVLADSGEQARNARDRGTEIHAAIQGHFEGKAPSEEFWPYVQGVLAVLRDNCGEQPWVSEKACAHGLGFGTKSDLHSPAWVIDWKGADFTAADIGTLKTWDEHAMQLAATRRALQAYNARCAIGYVSRVSPGLARLICVDEPELERGWSMFCSLLDYWQAKNNYYPQRFQVAA